MAVTMNSGKMRQSIEDSPLSHQNSTESVNGKGNGSPSCKTNRLNGTDNSASYSFRLNPPAATKSPMAKKLVKSATSSALLSTRHLQRNESISSVSSDASSDMTLDELEIIKTIGTGTFGRVVLVYDQVRSEYGALKILQLHDVIRLKQVDHVKNEKNILKAVKHPFIVNMKWHYKDESNIYMLFDYVCGGELFSYLRRAGKFSSATSAFYGAEIVCALEYLHGKSIVYRDLKPENLLLDKEGHLKITDFGFAKQLKDRTWTLCGTPEYLAPEIIQSKGHNRAVDWWALGVLIYEMNCGFAPFYDDNNFSTYEKILAAKLEWPKYIDPVAKDLIKKLLVPDRFKRLGNMKNGADDVKRHRWFRDYDWDDVSNRRLQPPIIPKVTFDGDTRNFDEYPEEETWRTNNGINDTEMKLFADF